MRHCKLKPQSRTKHAFRSKCNTEPSILKLSKSNLHPKVERHFTTKANLSHLPHILCLVSLYRALGITYSKNFYGSNQSRHVSRIAMQTLHLALSHAPITGPNIKENPCIGPISKPTTQQPKYQCNPYICMLAFTCPHYPKAHTKHLQPHTTATSASKPNHALHYINPDSTKCSM